MSNIVKNKTVFFRHGRLAPPFRMKMEQVFHDDLSDIELIEFEPAHPSDSPLACVMENRVYFSSRLNHCAEIDQARVLAHELIHCIQKRSLSPRPGSMAELELEAEVGSRAAIEGRTYHVQLSDAAGVPRFWGPAGHFYTCLFVMLAAGVPDGVAFIRAFFCQLPDVVTEFDATAAGKDALRAFRDFPSEVAKHPASASKVLAETKQRVLEDAQVSSGLHSLTGGKAIEEQGYCYKELKGIFTSNDHLAIGLALHAFGDSFAHVQLRNPKGLMYRTGIGHAAELVGKPARDKMLDNLKDIGGDAVDAVVHPGDQARRAQDAKRAAKEAVKTEDDIMKIAEAPDDITLQEPHHVRRYQHYVEELYDISRSFPGKPKLTRQRTVELLAKWAAHCREKGEYIDEDKVIHHIRTLSKQYLKTMNLATYPFLPGPEDKTVPFNDFFEKYSHPYFDHAGYVGPMAREAAYHRIRSLAAKWARGFTSMSFTP